MITEKRINDLDVLVLENDLIRTEVVPDIGGKLISVYNKEINREFLWNDPNLELKKLPIDSDYESNFWGGIDELIPNDIIESVDDLVYPDHGELWTTALDCNVTDSYIGLSGLLERSGLYYQKTVSLAANEPRIILDYIITNRANTVRHFLWKLHAAMRIDAGDQLLTTATKARIVDPRYSRFTSKNEFDWSVVEGVDASYVPMKNGTMDFFYLYDISEGVMSMLSKEGKHRFSYYYDQTVFPYQWYFATYGQFRGLYTVVLEPATAMPVSVNEAAASGQCSVLMPGESIQTTIEIYAGKNI